LPGENGPVKSADREDEQRAVSDQRRADLQGAGGRPPNDGDNGCALLIGGDAYSVRFAG
jgi:hypothetical protein